MLMVPLVSIVICTRDRPEDLARALSSIRACPLESGEAEIVVVEETNTPHPIPGTTYIALPRENRGFGFVRNRSVQSCKGEIVVFIDDDCQADIGWLSALTAPLLSDGNLLGVAGAVLVRDCSLIGYAENILGFPGGGLRYLHEAKGRMMPTRHLSTCNCAYRRDAILRVGGFDEEARWGGEDFLLAERVSALGRCIYTPHAVVYHRPRGQLGAIFRWFVRRGQSDIAFLKLTNDPRASVLFLLRSSWTLRFLVLLMLLIRWPQVAPWLPAAIMAYYGAIVWRFRFARAYPSHRRAWWLVPIVKATMDLGTELGRWKALVGRGRR